MCDSVMFDCVSVCVCVYTHIFVLWVNQCMGMCFSVWACVCSLQRHKGKWKEKDYKRGYIVNVHRQTKSRNLILKDYEAERACIEIVPLNVPSGKFFT